MENNIYPLIQSQVPEHLREGSPLFSEFLETYYQYASIRENSIGLIQNQALDLDIDTSSDQYIDKFYYTYAQYFPQSFVYDKRNFIKLLSTIYDSKGTEKALKLVFKLIFNDDISVQYPVEQILRASDGKWEQDSYITVQSIYGSIPNTPFSLNVTNTFGQYGLNILKTLTLDNANIRLYYKSINQVQFVDSQLIKVYNDAGTLIFVGQLVKSISSIFIKEGGYGWQIGQLIFFTGTILNTIARVTQIDPLGSIIGIEIVENGFSHTEFQTISVSPYPNRPSGSQIDRTLTPIAGGGFAYTLTISDNTDGCYESVQGLSSVKDGNSYFLEDYVMSDYTGQLIVNLLSEQAPSPVYFDDSITIDAWLASRATLILESGFVIKTKGRFLDNSGKISNQEIRLQDNYYYQAYSYVINTMQEERDYSKIMELTHVAGTKRFSNLVKEVDYTFNFVSSRTNSMEQIIISDFVASSDSISMA
jgi:hypothetical protein